MSGFNGNIHDFRIYKKYLSQRDITNIILSNPLDNFITPNLLLKETPYPTKSSSILEVKQAEQQSGKGPYAEHKMPPLEKFLETERTGPQRFGLPRGWPKGTSGYRR